MRDRFSLVRRFNDDYIRKVVKRNGKVYVLKVRKHETNSSRMVGR